MPLSNSPTHNLPPLSLAHHQTRESANARWLSGFFTGVVTATVFHPADRWMYLAQVHQQAAGLHRAHPLWKSVQLKGCMQGFSQTFWHRMLGGGLYPVFRGYCQPVKPFAMHYLNCSDKAAHSLVGLATGAMYAVSMNSVSAVKYHTWGSATGGFCRSVSQMWRQGGVSAFTKGTAATVCRDGTFGVVYEGIRHWQDAEPSALNNALAATVAACSSSFFNFIRNDKYRTSPKVKPATTLQALRRLHQGAQQLSQLDLMLYYAHRLRIGWGTLRVIAGLVVAEKVFSSTQALLDSSLAASRPSK